MTTDTRTIEKVFSSRREALALKGRLFRFEGRIYRALTVSGIGPSLTFTDSVTATVEMRPATPAEEIKTQIAELERENDKLFFSDDPGNRIAAESRVRRAEIKAQIANLQARLTEVQ